VGAVASPVRTEFRAMGTDCDIVIHGGPADLDVLAEAHVRDLDAQWSRFRSDSELALLNVLAGTGRVPASPTMRVLVRAMLAAFQITNGLCDASVHDSVIGIGYDADFDAVVARGTTPVASVTGPPPGLTGVEVGRDWVSLPDGVHLDSGAVGKGLGADLVASRIMAAGAAGCAVNLGGDVVIRGTTIDGSPWVVGVDDARNPGESLLGFELPEGGAIATSSILKRRWADKHHVIDPRTGDSARTDICQATVIANEGWLAEAAATAALLLGSHKAPVWMAEHDLHGLLVTTDNHVIEV